MVHSLDNQTISQKHDNAWDMLDHIKNSPSFYDFFRKDFQTWPERKKYELIADLFATPLDEQDYSVGVIEDYCPCCSLAFFDLHLRLCNCKRQLNNQPDVFAFLTGGGVHPSLNGVLQCGISNLTIHFEMDTGIQSEHHVPDLLAFSSDSCSDPLEVADSFGGVHHNNNLEEISFRATGDILNILETGVANSLVFSSEGKLQIYDVRPTLNEFCDKFYSSPFYRGRDDFRCRNCPTNIPLVGSLVLKAPRYTYHQDPGYDKRLSDAFFKRDEFVSVFNYWRPKRNGVKPFASNNLYVELCQRINVRFLSDLERDYLSYKSSITDYGYSYFNYDRDDLRLSYFIYALKCFMESVSSDGSVNIASNYDVFEYMPLELFADYINGTWDELLFAPLFRTMCYSHSLEEIYYAVRYKSYGFDLDMVKRLKKFIVPIMIKFDQFELFFMNAVKNKYDKSGYGFLSRDYRWNSFFIGDTAFKMKYRSLINWDLH